MSLAIKVKITHPFQSIVSNKDLENRFSRSKDLLKQKLQGIFKGFLNKKSGKRIYRSKSDLLLKLNFFLKFKGVYIVKRVKYNSYRY